MGIKCIYTSDIERSDLIVKYNRGEGLSVYEPAPGKIWFYSETEMIKDGEIVENTSYASDKAKSIRANLIEGLNFNLKSSIAYVGVRFDYKGDTLLFETNKESLSLINFTVTMAQANKYSMIPGWKCRKITAPYEPVSVDFSVEQFKKILDFATSMVLGAFGVETEFNAKINAATVEELNNEEFVSALEEEMKAAYAKLPIKIEGLFPTEVAPSEPVPESTETTEEPTA